MMFFLQAAVVIIITHCKVLFVAILVVFLSMYVTEKILTLNDNFSLCGFADFGYSYYKKNHDKQWMYFYIMSPQTTTAMKKMAAHLPATKL